MKSVYNFFTGICMVILASLDAWAQESSRVQVDPGISVHNYKHRNKAVRAKKMEPVVRQRTSPRVGIVRRSSASPMPKEQHQTPKYARRSGWIFFKRSKPIPSVISPLTNPNNYKTN